MLNINYPVELSFTLVSGRYVDVSLTYAQHVPPSFDWNDPPDHYYGWTDVEYLHKEKLTAEESTDLERRLKRYVEGIYNSYIHSHKRNPYYSAFYADDF